MKKIITKILIMICLLIIFNTSSLLAEDIVENEYWASDMMSQWRELGILTGQSGDELGMTEYITKVESITILNRINNVDIEIKKDDEKFKDVEGFRWYYDEVEKAIATGILSGTPTGEIKPKETITREEAFAMIAKFFDIKYTGEKEPKEYLLTAFDDGSECGNWSSPYIAGLAELGYITGYYDNTLRAKDKITRAEYIKVLDNIVGQLITKPGEYDLSDVTGIVVVNTPGVKITALNEDARIYLTSGSNKEVEVELEELTEVDEEVPLGLRTIGDIDSNVDYSVFKPTPEEQLKKTLNTLGIVYKMPTVHKLSDTTSKQYYGKVSGTDQWNDYILKIASEEEVDPVFVKCIMALETGGKAGGVSKQNTNGTHDYGLMQVNSGWGTSFNYPRMLTDNEYAIRCGVIVIKRKIEAAERSGKLATVHEVAWRYNGYNNKGRQYADRFSKLYEDLSGKPSSTLVRISKSVLSVN